MSNSVTVREVPFAPRVDEGCWRLRCYEVAGERPGPVTAFVSGMDGDRGLGSLAMHHLIARLRTTSLAGRVVVVPAANPPALGVGQRESPEHRALNRSFPGRPDGLVVERLADALVTELLDRCHHLVDVHSGTPSRSARFVFDFGDVAFSASWGGGYPVVTGRALPPQLCSVAAERGVPSLLAEFGGGPFDDPVAGVDGSLNVLRHLGQVEGPAPDPSTSPLVPITGLRRFVASTYGILVGPLTAADVGGEVPEGLLGQIVGFSTGDVVEEFVADRPGGRLLAAAVQSAVMAPGTLAFSVGYPEGSCG